MLKRQNAKLVSLIIISGEEFVSITLERPAKKSTKNKTQFDLEVQM